MWYDKVQMNTVKQLVHLEIPLIIYCSKRIDGGRNEQYMIWGEEGGKTTALKISAPNYLGAHCYQNHYQTAA